MKKLISSLSFIFLTLAGVTSHAKAGDPVLTIHAVNFPPYEIENPGVDSLLGFDVEVAIEAFKRVGKKATVDFLPWKRIVAKAKRGTTMAMLSCGKSAGRGEYINYSDPISTATRTYVASVNYKGAIPYSIVDAQGMKILAVSGYSTEKELRAAKVDFEPVIDDRAALRILLNRGYDLFYSAREFVEYVASNLDIAEKIQYFNTQKQVDYHLCFSKEWPNSNELRDIFNIGLTEIRKDGTFDAIHAKYK